MRLVNRKSFYYTEMFSRCCRYSSFLSSCKQNGDEWPLRKTANLLQLRLEAGAERVQVRVAADVLLAKEDVGHGALAGDLLEGVLDGAAVACCVSEDVSGQLLSPSLIAPRGDITGRRGHKGLGLY